MLAVPVPPLEPFVRSRTRHHDPEWLSTDPRFGHAHVTALAPFVPEPELDAGVLARVGEIAAATSPFTFVLRRIDTFPNGIIHLVPEPDDPFRALTRALCEAFPAHLPYAGEFGDVRPHVTLDAVAPAQGTTGAAEISEASTRALLGTDVPATCRAERLDLTLWVARGCRVLATWALGGGPPALR